MSNIKQSLEALEQATYKRLISINETIRNKRSVLTKEQLTYYKQKRKETDQLLSSIKTTDTNNELDYKVLNRIYLDFNIMDSI